MSEVNREIGSRIKEIREISDMSHKELADIISIEVDQLVEYESGNTEIPVSVLHSISSKLEISMTELLTGESAKLSIYSLMRNDKGIGVERRKAYDYKALAYNFANRRMDPFLITIPVTGEEPFNQNSHTGQEFHYCLEGSFQIKIDKHIVTINEGDSIYFDSSYPHGMKALGDKPVKELVIII